LIVTVESKKYPGQGLFYELLHVKLQTRSFETQDHHDFCGSAGAFGSLELAQYSEGILMVA